MSESQIVVHKAIYFDYYLIRSKSLEHLKSRMLDTCTAFLRIFDTLIGS